VNAIGHLESLLELDRPAGRDGATEIAQSGVEA